MPDPQSPADLEAVIAEGRMVVTGAPRDLIAAAGAANLEEMILKQTDPGIGSI